MAYKSPTPLQAQVFYISPAYAMVFFQGCNDFAHKSWHMGRTAPTYTFSKNIFPIYFTVICYATAYLIQVSCYQNCLAVLFMIFFVIINVLMAVGKT